MKPIDISLIDQLTATVADIRAQKPDLDLFVLRLPPDSFRQLAQELPQDIRRHEERLALVWPSQNVEIELLLPQNSQAMLQMLQDAQPKSKVVNLPYRRALRKLSQPSAAASASLALLGIQNRRKN